MSNSHHIIPDRRLFSPEGWQEFIDPLIDRLEASPGGCVAVLLNVDPMRQNYVTTSCTVFDASERKAIRKAVERCRAKRQPPKIDSCLSVNFAPMSDVNHQHDEHGIPDLVNNTVISHPEPKEIVAS